MNTQLLDLSEISREDWLELRGIGSSDAAAICGLNPYKSRYHLWLEKIGAVPPPDESEAMRFGQLLEPVIAEEFAHRTELNVRRAQIMFYHPEHKWMTATPDYFCEGGLLEIKSTSAHFGKDWQEGIPDAAHIQLMHQLAVTELDFGYVAALVGGNKLFYHRVNRDPELIRQIVNLETDFWELVEKKTPPPLEPGDEESISLLYPRSVESTVVLTEAALGFIERYRTARQAEKDAKAEADYAAAHLKQMIGDAEAGICGQFRMEWKTIDKKPYSVKASSYRKFSIKEANDNGANEY